MTPNLQTGRSSKAARVRTQIAQEVLGATVALLFMLPLIWMLLGAFKAQREVFTGPLIPETWVFSNFWEAWNAAPFGRYFLNSMLVATLTTVSVVLTSSLAAFAFARLEFPGKKWLFLVALGTLMIPGDVLLIPNFTKP
jgi:multiple sugar transport system permease protein